MSFFDEQVHERINHDKDIFSSSLHELTDFIGLSSKKKPKSTDEDESIYDALKDIAKFFGIPEDKVLQQKSYEIEDKNKKILVLLENIFSPSGVMRRDVNLIGDWYKNAAGVYLTMTKDKYFVALIPDFNGYKYKDFTTGEIVRINSKTKDNLGSAAICFYTPLPSEKLSIKDLLKFIAKTVSFADVFYISLTTLFITLFSMVTPFFMKLIFSETVYSKNMTGLTAIFAFILVSGISLTVLQIAKTLFLTRIQLKTDVSVTAAVMMRILNLPTSFFKNYSAGELTQKVSFMKLLCTSLSNVVFSTGLTALISLIYLFQIFSFNPMLSYLAFFVMMTVFAASVVLAWRYSINLKMRTEFQAKEFAFLYSLITGMQKIKLSGSERRAFAKWVSIYKNSAKLEFNPPLLLKLNQMIQPAITLTGTFLVYVFGIMGGVSTEDYMAFTSSYALLSAAFMTFSQSNLLTAAIFPLLNLVKPVLEEVPEISQGKILSRIRGGISLENVSFKYGEHLPLILNKLTMRIRAGDYVAIVGKSGCGKSTLMRLLLGFEQPDSGVIYYDGNDIKTLDLKYLRRNIGCVMQNSRLFSGNIFSNITISAPQLTEEDAWKAAEMAGIADDIHKMPMQMNTMITEGSGSISGGQRQRIIIARAIASKPKILLFDEATSALDNITQKIVSDSLAELKCTRIVIAHRLSTVKNCDKIFVLDEGRIAEAGNYEELIKKQGLFASLVKRQQLGEAV